MERVAIVLAGGRSSRMGRDKASLEFAGQTLLDRVVAAAESVAPCLVVAGPEQPVTLRSKAARLVRDPASTAHEGPLRGFATGLRALETPPPIALLLAADAPFLSPALLRHLCERLEAAPDHDAIVPRVGDHVHPLVAAYRGGVLKQVEELLATGSRSLRVLLAEIRVDSPTEVDLEPFDPGLRSFVDVDTPDAFAHALDLEQQGPRPR